MIGADGLRSVVGRRLGLTHFARVPRRLAFVTHYRGVARDDVARRDARGARRLRRPRRAWTTGSRTWRSSRRCRARARRRDAPTSSSTEWIAQRPHLAPRFARRRARRRTCASPAPSRSARGARGIPAPRSSATPPTSSTRSPAKGSTPRSAAANCSRRSRSRRSPRPPPRAPMRRSRRTIAARRAEFAGKWQVERLVGLAVGSPALMNRVVAPPRRPPRPHRSPRRRHRRLRPAPRRAVARHSLAAALRRPPCRLATRPS